MQTLNCGANGPPPDIEHLPLYPGAHHVRVEEKGALRITAFQALAAPEAVLAWYKERLVEARWKLEEVNSWGLRLYYLGGVDADAYRLSVLITSTDVDQTSIELHLVTEYAM